MLIVRYSLADGTVGEDIVHGDRKWVFGRPGGGEEPDVSVSDPRVSRSALVVRDSGPGPVVFCGQRGTQARVGLVDTEGSTTWLEEGTAGNLTDSAHTVVLVVDETELVRIDVDFADRGSVVERQQRTEASS